ncbi:MAG: phenylacetate--CoA ligase [Bacteroidaceae bacterium]|jgi:phenylacetate-CoA ligase|nr:phenylacetate--CoA ligase [Bacteroidaceae bacterium]MBO5932470.1 phenylacetate--CoA ligase [Bacteroidaceae bacterium]MBQ5574282.1 phenylacetate--CoA ligase [Bacteroidaceae bacterium]
MSNKYWNEEIETMPRKQLEQFQVERLKKTVEIAMGSNFYAPILKERNITPESIKSVEDIRRFPFTTKNDLRENYPFGLASVPLNKVVRLHSSSGTTGNPTVILHSQRDIEQWADAMARSMYTIGLRSSDIIQNTSGYGMFTGGLGIQYASERLGALTVPAGAGNSKRHVKFIMDFGTTALHCIPSYATRLAAAFQEEGINPADTTVHTLIIGAEPHSDAQRKRIEEIWGAKAYNNFGMSEMCGPGVAIECQEQNGLHIWEDNYIVEIVDPVTLEPVADGEVGELVLTTLNREAMPLFRYRTRDLTRFLPGDCPCGRTHRRLARFQGRSDDMIIVKGVNIFPIQIEKILMQFPELASDYLITIETVGDNDEMTIEVELAQSTDDFALLQNLTKEIARRLKDEILLTPRVKLVGKGVIPQTDGKAVRVKDLRQNH